MVKVSTKFFLNLFKGILLLIFLSLSVPTAPYSLFFLVLMSKVEDLEFSSIFWKLQIGTKVENLTYPEYYNIPQKPYIHDRNNPTCYCSEYTEGNTVDNSENFIFGECYRAGYSDCINQVTTLLQMNVFWYCELILLVSILLHFLLKNLQQFWR